MRVGPAINNVYTKSFKVLCYMKQSVSCTPPPASPSVGRMSYIACVRITPQQDFGQNQIGPSVKPSSLAEVQLGYELEKMLIIHKLKPAVVQKKTLIFFLFLNFLKCSKIDDFFTFLNLSIYLFICLLKLVFGNCSNYYYYS